MAKVFLIYAAILSGAFGVFLCAIAGATGGNAICLSVEEHTKTLLLFFQIAPRISTAFKGC